MNVIQSEHKTIYVLSDLDIHFLTPDMHTSTYSLFEQLYSYHVFPVITKPTRVTETSATMTNHILEHYCDVTMSAMASQITGLTIVYSTVHSGADQRNHQSSASLAFVRGIHWWPVNSLHKWSVTQKLFPFDDVIMTNSFDTDASHIKGKFCSILDNYAICYAAGNDIADVSQTKNPITRRNMCHKNILKLLLMKWKESIGNVWLMKMTPNLPVVNSMKFCIASIMLVSHIVNLQNGVTWVNLGYQQLRNSQREKQNVHSEKGTWCSEFVVL